MDGSGRRVATDAASPKIALPRKIIYTGEVTLVCENLDRAAGALEGKIKEFGGYVSNAQRTGVRGQRREGFWTVRLPAGQFDAFVAALSALGEMQSSSRKADDVSEEFYDVQARLKNKRVEEARLIALLQKATGKLAEVLTVEKELTRVREETERIEGRLRYLANQTDLATVTVTLNEVKDFVPAGPPTLGTQLARSFSGSLDAMKNVATAFLVFSVALVPWLIPLGLIAWGIARLAGRKRPS